MKPFKLVTDPKAFQLIGDETRRKIIYLLRAKEMTVSQLAEELRKTPQAVYHQIAKLRDVGMVEVSKEERIGHFIESYYRATAEVFQFSHGEDKECKDLAKKEMAEAFKQLPKLGYKIKADTKTIKHLVDLQSQMSTIGVKDDLEKNIADLENIDFGTKQCLTEYAQFLDMSDKEFEKYMKSLEEYRSILRSLLQKR